MINIIMPVSIALDVGIAYAKITEDANSLKSTLDLSQAESGTDSLPEAVKVYAKMSEEAYKDPNARKEKIGAFKYLKVKSL